MAFKNDTPFASWRFGANGFLIGPDFLDGHEGRIHDSIKHCLLSGVFGRLNSIFIFVHALASRLGQGRQHPEIESSGESLESSVSRLTASFSILPSL